VYPIGAVTARLKGETLSEMAELAEAAAWPSPTTASAS
jgi:hypothetical protein